MYDKKRVCNQKLPRWFLVGAMTLIPSLSNAIVISDGGNFPLDTLPHDSTNPFYGVVNVNDTCSGTPISSRLIVTAAHCFDGNDPGGAPDYHSVNVYIIEDGVRKKATGTPISHPGYGGLINNRGRTEDFANDIAVIRLETGGIRETFSLAYFDQVPIGAVVEHVGYGLSGLGSTGATTRTSPYSLNATYNVIDTEYLGGLTFGTDFDGAGINRMGGGPLTFGNVLEGTTAPGDSGGPAFFNPYLQLQINPPPPGLNIKLVQDRHYLLGVTSWGNSTNNSGYGTTAGYTFVGAYRDWLMQFDTTLLFSNLGYIPLPDVASANYVIANDIVWNDPPPSSEPIPEPSALALAIVGLASLVMVRKMASTRV